MNSEVYKNILPAHLQRKLKFVSKLIGRNFTVQQDNDTEHTASTTKNFIREVEGFRLAKLITRF